MGGGAPSLSLVSATLCLQHELIYCAALNEKPVRLHFSAPLWVDIYTCASFHLLHFDLMSHITDITERQMTALNV